MSLLHKSSHTTKRIVLDTETTGLDFKSGHRIIEIAAVEMEDRRFTGNKFHYYLNPERTIDAEALAVHGLNEDFLKDKPKFAEIVSELLMFLKDSELVIHNASFDIGFIENELRLAKASISTLKEICTVTDTLVLARQLHSGQKNSLDALCKRYRINNKHRTLHGALLDANLLAQVYLAMTGGQSSFFGESFMMAEAPHKTDSKNQTKIAWDPQQFITQEATQEELLEHKKWSALLKKTAGESSFWE